ncbi:zinc-binding dehydrogenase [Streptomyces chrestomyceticus]|uniref:zinc-binding dehydrogenase n=1 Tax=Streptomyces chrestomyceticus TaxID=68185 RepID=UPI003F4CF3E6
MSPGGGRCSPRPGRAKLAALGHLVDQGELRPVTGAVLPLDDLAQAHTLLEGGAAGEGRRRPRGKIALAVHPLDEPPCGTTPWGGGRHARRRAGEWRVLFRGMAGSSDGGGAGLLQECEGP